MSESDRILELTRAVYTLASNKIEAIKKVTETTRILSLNALIEASRVGEAGKGFAVVANEVKDVSLQIDQITQSLGGELNRLQDLMGRSEKVVQDLRGARLADLAFNMIEIIDRNLYERSCDVRWWATDSAVVDCLTRRSAETASFASERLGVILDSYTVYLDLWVADADGRVVGNGRPGRYPRAVGADVRNERWFRQAMETSDGGEFAMADVAVNSELDGALVATYATAIREGGDTKGRPIGALGVFFDWRPQAEAVVKGVRLEADKSNRTRCLLVDRDRRVLAASDGAGVLTESVHFGADRATMGCVSDHAGRMIAYALTPGYETYRGMGWYGVIVQEPTAQETVC